jgi:glycine/D-amino acid oxidase-like deaminating enzyme
VPSRSAYGSVQRNDPDLIARSLLGASPTPFWLDSPERPAAAEPLSGAAKADLVVVGGGYCGLWTALIAKERDPDLRVILLESGRIGEAASGRNGGFVEATLTHGGENGRRHFAKELATLDRLGAENFAELADSLKRHGIDADFENAGVLAVATEEYQIAGLRSQGDANEFFDSDRIRSVVDSPLYLAGLMKRTGYGLVNPAKLAWGLKVACLTLGVEVHENTPAMRLDHSLSEVTVVAANGSVSAQQVALATNGFPSLLKRTSWLTLPVYDYVLMTEPLSDTQLDAIGWNERHGITDSAHQFHYYRKTVDNRILWGGYDAIYHRGRRVVAEQDQRPETFERLADHFFSTFPQLAGVQFSHAWGGMIDMSSRLVAFQGIAHGGRVAYSAGYTGLGVAATRFGAKVMLDLLGGVDTELTTLSMPTSKPIPIPPEPLAYPVVQLARRAIAASDANGGKDGWILRAMDRFGVSFDS